MSYTIIDIINNLIYIEEKGFEMFKKISQSTEDIRMKVLADTFAKQEQKHKRYYEDIKNNIEENLQEYIDFYAYDKISSKIQQFKSKLVIPNIDNVNKLINFAVELEEDNLALLLDVKGQLVRRESDTNTLAYNTMLTIIEEEKKHVELFTPYIKNKN
ncbi:hypothetical protein FDF74_06750 [Clostridium niameyense]|uniref:Rubrerythrin n=1 Tax=Clostridium niameyense TaxID=1622073 RepID=A0A6M0RBH0_9CLOT|nr:hypothetical protein [Clostridium niameyense]NEZ46909.1 hypothetical protein [Clostridium niameyense]